MGLPGIGESLAYWRDPDFVVKRLQRFGPVFKTSIFGHKVVFMLGREANRFIFTNQQGAFSSAGGYPGTMAALFGPQAPFLWDEAEHRDLRQVWGALFSPQGMALAVPQIDQICADHAARWQAHTPANWHTAFRHLTMEIMLMLLFGQGVSRSTADLCQLSAAVSRSMSPLLPLHWRTWRWGKAVQARYQLLAEIKQTFQQPKTVLQQDVLARFENDQHGAAGYLLFLLFAGHETLSTMLSSIQTKLADDPEMAAGLQVELAKMAATVDVEQLKRLDQLNRFLWEIERTAPTIDGLFRGVKTPVEFGPFTIPAGWLVGFRTRETHRDQTIYPEPELFDPGRFCPHMQGKPGKFELIGFGGGTHSCPGKSLAHLIMKIVIMHLLR